MSGATCYLELGEVDNLPLLEDEVSFAEPMGATSSYLAQYEPRAEYDGYSY
jgi:hypothetical protein